MADGRNHLFIHGISFTKAWYVTDFELDIGNARSLIQAQYADTADQLVQGLGKDLWLEPPSVVEQSSSDTFTDIMDNLTSNPEPAVPSPIQPTPIAPTPVDVIEPVAVEPVVPNEPVPETPVEVAADPTPDPVTEPVAPAGTSASLSSDSTQVAGEALNTATLTQAEPFLPDIEDDLPS